MNDFAPDTLSDQDSVRRTMSLVPAESIAGRALVIVIAIMTFLAALTAGGAILVSRASQDWRGSVAREMTIQVRQISGRDVDAAAGKAGDIARKIPGIGEVKVYTKAESERLLEPWLGSGLDLGQLPVPRLIVMKLDESGTKPDLAALRQMLMRDVPGSSLDDHAIWLDRLVVMANSIVIIALVIFALVVTTMILAVAFATRGAMAGNREIIDVLHMVGAADAFIADQFQRHFMGLGLKGGLLGAVLGGMAFSFAGIAASIWTASPGGDQVESLFGTFTLGWTGYGAILMIGLALALVTGLMSRMIVFRHLHSLS
jgi:cell division transport system permease protein